MLFSIHLAFVVLYVCVRAADLYNLVCLANTIFFFFESFPSDLCLLGRFFALAFVLSLRKYVWVEADEKRNKDAINALSLCCVFFFFFFSLLLS